MNVYELTSKISTLTYDLTRPLQSRPNPDKSLIFSLDASVVASRYFLKAVPTGEKFLSPIPFCSPFLKSDSGDALLF